MHSSLKNSLAAPFVNGLVSCNCKWPFVQATTSSTCFPRPNPNSYLTPFYLPAPSQTHLPGSAYLLQNRSSAEPPPPPTPKHYPNPPSKGLPKSSAASATSKMTRMRTRSFQRMGRPRAKSLFHCLPNCLLTGSGTLLTRVGARPRTPSPYPAREMRFRSITS